MHLEEERKIAFIVEVWIQGIILEDHSNVAFSGRDVLHILAVVKNLSTVLLFDPRDHAQQRAFPAAGRAHDGERLAVRNGQIDMIQRGNAR